MKRIIMAALTIAALPVASLIAATHYVVPAGTAGNTPTSPYTSWATAANDLASAIDAAKALETILVAPGTYSVSSTIDITSSGQSRNFLKIESYNSETGKQDPEHTILDGGGTTSIMVLNAQAVSLRGLTFANGYVESDSYTAQTAAGASAAIFINNNQIVTSGQGVISNCIFRCNKSKNVVGTCIYNYAKNPPLIVDCLFACNTQEVTVAKQPVRGSAIYQVISSAATADRYGKIYGCTFRDNVALGPKAEGSTVCIKQGRTVFDGCNFYTNSLVQTDSAISTEGAYLYLGDSTTVQNCRFSCKGFNNAGGHYLYGTVMSVLDGCTFSNCTFTAIEEESGSDLYGTIRVAGDSVKFLDCNFTENTLYANSLLFVENKGDALIRNCLFAGNDRKKNTARLIYRHGTTVSTPTGITVENCTFADNTDTIAPIYFSNASYANYLVNSVFTTDAILSGATESSVLASNCCFTALQEVGGLSFNDKCITVAKGSHKFADAANGDYRLQGRSPLRDKGVTLDWMTDGSIDLDGNPRVFGDSPDIGCYECVARYPGFTLFVR